MIKLNTFLYAKCNLFWLYIKIELGYSISIGDDTMFKIQKEYKNANISRTVRFTEPLFERLNTLATQNDISFNLLVLQCCKYALDNQEDTEPSEKVI